MAASSDLKPSDNAYVAFRDRSDFQGFDKFLRDKLTQDLTSSLYNFEREQELANNKNRSPAEQNELDEILAIRVMNEKYNKDYPEIKKQIEATPLEIKKTENEIDETMYQLENISNRMEKITNEMEIISAQLATLPAPELSDDETNRLRAEGVAFYQQREKLLKEQEDLFEQQEVALGALEEKQQSLEEKQQSLEQKRVELDAERTKRVDEYVQLAKTFTTTFPFPSVDYKFTPQGIEGKPTGDPRELTGSELKEFQFLYQLQVTELALNNPRFKELAQKPADQLNDNEKKELADYQPQLLERTERAKRAFEFTCAGNHRVNWPIGSEKQYFNAVQLVAGIDLSKRVDVDVFEPGALLLQKQSEAAQGQDIWVGNFFVNAETRKATASETGIAAISEGSVKQALIGKSSTKVNFGFETTEPVALLRTTARPVGDTWSMPGRVAKTTGGGEQLFIPIPRDDKKRVFQRVTPIELLDAKIKKVDSKLEAAKDDPAELARLNEEKAKLITERKEVKERIEKNVIENMSAKQKRAQLRLEGREADPAKRILPVEGVKTKIAKLEAELNPSETEYKQYKTDLKNTETDLKKSEVIVKQIEAKLAAAPAEEKSRVEQELKESNEQLANHKQKLDELKANKLYPLRELKKESARLKLIIAGSELTTSKLKEYEFSKEQTAQSTVTEAVSQPKADPVISRVEVNVKPLNSIEALSKRNEELVNLIKDKQATGQQEGLPELKKELENNIASMEKLFGQEKLNHYSLRLVTLNQNEKVNEFVLKEAEKHNSPILIRRRDETAIRLARSTSASDEKAALGNDMSSGFRGWKAEYSVYGRKANGTWGETEIKPGSSEEKMYLDKLNSNPKGFAHWNSTAKNRAHILPNANHDVLLNSMIERGHTTPVHREVKLIQQSKIAANSVHPGMYADPSKIQVETTPKFEQRSGYSPMLPAHHLGKVNVPPPPPSPTGTMRNLFSRKESEAEPSSRPSLSRTSTMRKITGLFDQYTAMRNKSAMKTLDNQQKTENQEKTENEITPSKLRRG